MRNRFVNINDVYFSCLSSVMAMLERSILNIQHKIDTNGKLTKEGRAHKSPVDIYPAEIDDLLNLLVLMLYHTKSRYTGN